MDNQSVFSASQQNSIMTVLWIFYDSEDIFAGSKEKPPISGGLLVWIKMVDSHLIQ